MADKFMEKKLEKCSSCEKTATWFYAPIFSGKKPEESFFCDEHVPRGCDCNNYYKEEFKLESEIDLDSIKFFKNVDNYQTKEVGKEDDWDYYTHVDEKGRLYPCCEYWYDENGWEKED